MAGEKSKPKKKVKQGKIEGINNDAKLYGALSYIFGVFSGILVLLIKGNESKFIKFHALQAIIFSLSMSVIIFGLLIISLPLGIIPIIGAIIGLFFVLFILILAFGGFLANLFFAYKAYNGELFEIPFIGKIAKQHS